MNALRQSIAGKSETRLADDILVSNALYPNIFTPVQTVGIGRQNLPTVQKWRHYVFFHIDLATGNRFFPSTAFGNSENWQLLEVPVVVCESQGRNREAGGLPTNASLFPAHFCSRDARLHYVRLLHDSKPNDPVWEEIEPNGRL